MSDQKPSTPNGNLDNFPEHCRLIMHIISRWNGIEFLAIYVLAGMMHTHHTNVARMVYALRNSQARLDVIDAGIAGLAGDYEFEERIFAALKKAKACLKARNRYAHCSYLSSAEGKKLQRWDWSDEGGIAVYDLKLPNLRNEAKQVEETYQELENILGRIATKERPLTLRFKRNP